MGMSISAYWVMLYYGENNEGKEIPLGLKTKLSDLKNCFLKSSLSAGSPLSLLQVCFCSFVVVVEAVGQDGSNRLRMCALELVSFLSVTH